jgi:hypothetical protein
MAAMHDLALPHDKVNVHGGACALGHPIGASGARVIVTLIGALKKHGKKRGVASLCIGGGEATASASSWCSHDPEPKNRNRSATCCAISRASSSPPGRPEWDRTSHFPREELRALGELGCCGMVVPEQWGGAGLDYVSLALALEEIAAGDGATSTIISVQNSVVCGPINAFGTTRRRRNT